MPVLDDEGRLFGAVNVVDALVVLFVLAVVVAGVALVTGADDDSAAEPEPETRTVVVQTGDQPEYVVDAIEAGPVGTANVVSVDEVTVERSTETVYRVQGGRLELVNDSRDLYRVRNGSLGRVEQPTTTLRLTATLTVEETDDGLPTFGDGRLYVGREVRLDLGRTIVQGTVVDMRR